MILLTLKLPRQNNRQSTCGKRYFITCFRRRRKQSFNIFLLVQLTYNRTATIVKYDSETTTVQYDSETTIVQYDSETTIVQYD